MSSLSLFPINCFNQADKLRKRDNWSKYTAAVEHTSPVKAQMSKDQIAGTVISNEENNMISEVRMDGATETAAICSSSSDNLAEVSRNDNKLKGEDQKSVKVINDSDKQALVHGQPFSDEKQSSESNIKYAVPPDVASGSSTNDKVKAHKPTREAFREDDIIDEQREMTMNLDDLSADFSGTFMLDEELEIERKMQKKGVHGSCKR